jgi:exodeoxyribonuclease V
MLTADQQQVLDTLMSRCKYYEYNSSNPLKIPAFEKVGGYAGTGKTHLISILRKELKTENSNLRVAFCSFTGKAASVLRKKLEEQNAIYKGDYVGTIHSLMYYPKMQFDKLLNKFIIVGWKVKYNDKNFGDDYDMMIIDEASMISKSIWDDLMSLNTLVIAFGDHEQLPPVEDSFQYNPTMFLKTIHRQALNSPIIQLSMNVRKNGFIPRNTIFSERVFKIPYYMSQCHKIIDSVDFINDDVIILCGFNVSRCSLNKMIRTKLDFTIKEPYLSEKVICLKNNHSLKLMNGQIGKVLWVSPIENNLIKLLVEVDNEIYDCCANTATFGEAVYQFNNYDQSPRERYKKNSMKKKSLELGFDQIDYFDYGYSTSVHKSQGSEWDKVIVIEQRSKHWDDNFYRRWLYTAVTRAKESLMIVSDFNG